MPILAGMDKSVIIQGKPLHYRVVGKGSPVLLLHGFAEDSRIWDTLEAPLAGSYQLILPDIPGSGKSEAWEGNENDAEGSSSPSLEDLAEAMKQVLDAEGIGTCTMIGHSMGGYITLAFAEKYPGRLDGFGLFHSTADPDGPEKKEARRKGMAFMTEHGAERFLRQSIPNLFAEKFRVDHPAEVEELLARGNGFTAKTLRQYYRAMIQRPDRKGVLNDSKVPVLFIMGEQDKTINLQDVLCQSHLPSIAHVLVWQGVAHMGMREVPQLSMEALMKFLRHAKGHPIEQATPPHPRS
jgi:pimeloyl-ACP methyl ester carboxylesterase